MKLVTAQSVECIKWLALACMVVDHIATIFYGGVPVMNAIGRIAMPAFAIALAFNLARPGARANGVFGRVVMRLVLVGSIALPFHVAAFDSGLFNLNILFTFAAAVGVVWLLETRQPAWALLVFLVAGRVVEYWWPGLAVLVAAYYFFKRPGYVTSAGIIAAVASLAIVNGTHWALLVFPVLACVTAIRVELPRNSRAFYVFYPGHLAAFALLAWGMQ